MKFSTKIIEFINALKQIGYFTIFILGIIIIVASAFLSFQYVPTKILSILTTVIGSCLGMSIIINSFNKISILRHKHEKERLLQEKNDLEKAKILQEKINVQEREIHQLQIDKRRLESMRINVNSISPILRLGLLELDCTLKDFKHKVLSSEEINAKKIPILNIEISKHKSYTHEFIGIVSKTFKAQFGIDLSKVRVTLIDDKIIVSEVKSEFQGILEDKNHWLLKELRVKYEKNGELENHQIIPWDGRIVDEVIEQDEEFKRRLYQGIDFKNTENLIINLGQNFIRLILLPLNRNIVFSQSIESSGSYSLLEFISDQNSLISDEITQLEKKELMLSQSNLN